MAVPPASASMPTEDMEAARARISVEDSPAIVPADARRVAMAMMLASSVAKLLPKSTIAEPSLSTSSLLSPVMFMNLASDVAASCALTLVVSPSIIMTLVNFSISSAPIPSCPAASATAAISVLELAVSVDIFLMASAISA